MTYIKLEDVKKMFLDLALKSRGDDTIRYIYLKDEILKLPSINLDDYRKRRIVCGDPFPPRDR